MECTQWSGLVKAHLMIPTVLNITFNWMPTIILYLSTVINPDKSVLNVLQGSETRRVFTIFDEMIEFCCRNHVDRYNSEVVGALFMFKYYRFKKIELITKCKVTETEFDNARPTVMDFQPTCHSTFDYLYYCKHPDFSIKDRRELKNKYSQVLELLINMYRRDDWYLLNPMRRAKWIKDVTLEGASSDTEINDIFNKRGLSTHNLTQLIMDGIAEPTPKYA